MERLWQYTLNGELTNRNAGYSMWGFAKKGDTEYFVKQFLSPKFPFEDTESSPERLEKKMKECQLFAAKKEAVYRALNAGSDGNDVRVREFFRVQSRFYITMDKVEALPWTIETISQFPAEEIRRLCAIVAHAISGLHAQGLIHADIKHENILYTQLPSRKTTAKVIDFDNSFLESDPPGEDEEIIGDFNYFAPEVCARIYGEQRSLTCKLDIFSLGVLFHQYFSGELPKFQGGEYSCPGEAALKGYQFLPHGLLPKDISILLASMLVADPDQRPSTREVFLALRSKGEDLHHKEAPVPETSASPIFVSSDPFKKAGDLL